MASYEQRFYCKDCKKLVKVENGLCILCNNKSIKSSWTVRFRYVTPLGNEKMMRLTGFQTKREAIINYEEFTHKRKYIKSAINVAKLTFMEAYNIYEEQRKSEMKESSFLILTNVFSKHVLTFFSNFKIVEIDRTAINDWKKEMIRKELSYSYKNKILVYFNNFLNHLEKNYGVHTSILKITMIKNVVPKREMQIYDETEFQSFLNSIDDKDDYALFLFLYLIGCRKGEALALNWNDVDFEKGAARFNKTITKNIIKESSNQLYKITSPKTQNSNRIVLMPEILKNVIMELYNREKLRKDFDSSDFIFGGKRSIPFQSLKNRMEKYRVRAKLKQIRVHDLRHSSASYFINKAKNQSNAIYIVAHRLGDTVEQILKTYGHLFPNEEQKLLDSFDIKF